MNKELTERIKRDKLKRYLLGEAWEVKAGVIIETASSVYMTEQRASELTKAGILGGPEKKQTKK